MIYVYAAIGVLILVLFGYGQYEHHGKVSAIASLTAYKQSVAVTAAKAVQEQADKIAAQEKANALIVSNLQATLGESAARGIDLARRLRIATAAVSSRPVPKAGDITQPVSPSGASGDDALTAATGEAFGECLRNADRLDALIAEINGQL
jgi:hypothetical protein